MSHNYHGYFPLAVKTSRSFLHSRLFTLFLTRLTRRLPLVYQEQLTLPEHMSSPLDFNGVRITRSLVLYGCLLERCLPFSTFSFGPCVVCSSANYGLWLPHWYHLILIPWPHGFTKKSVWSCNCVLQVSILTLSTILKFEFGIVPIAKPISFSSYSNKIIHCGDQLNWWKIVDYPLTTSLLVQITDEVYHMILHRVHLAMNRVRAHNFGGDMH